MRIWLAAPTVLALAIAAANALAGWTPGTFQSAGMPVDEYHCAPVGAGRYPAVILLHGATRRGDDYRTLQNMCADLAARGYYAEMIEYYSQTGDISAMRFAAQAPDFPIWLEEIQSGIESLDRNPHVDRGRAALMGFSLGAFLSLATGASSPGRVAAIVEYYGALPPAYQSEVSKLPPTLIIHGAKDALVPAASAHALDAVLTAAGRPHELDLYPDGEHGFNFPEMGKWYNAADAQDAWNRTMAFLSKYLATSGE